MTTTINNSRNNSRNNTVRWLVPIAALVLAACSKPPVVEESVPLVAVAAATITSDTIAQPVVATGTFVPRDEIPLAFKIGGVIARVTVDAGQPVRKGQLLATLDLSSLLRRLTNNSATASASARARSHGAITDLTSPRG